MGAELEAVRKEYEAVEAVARGADYPKADERGVTETNGQAAPS